MKYKKIKQKIKGKTYRLYIADTPKKQKTGLSNIDINKKEGMIFIYPDEQTNRSFTMAKTKHKLRLIFIDEKENIVHQAIGYPYQTKSIKCKKPSKYVIEILS
jgi:uncharacterized membrane protein (UPF0127 family)